MQGYSSSKSEMNELYQIKKVYEKYTEEGDLEMIYSTSVSNFQFINNANSSYSNLYLCLSILFFK